MSMCIQHCWLYGVASCADPGIFARGGRGVRKNSDNVFRHQLFYSFKEGYQWFILRKTVFFKVPEGVQQFTGDGVQFFSREGGGTNVNIELVNF